MMKNSTTTARAKVFLSFAGVDHAHARRLGSFLSMAGAEVFTTETLSAAEDWLSIVRQEIAKCDAFAVVLTPNAVKSNFVLVELGAAWAMGKPIIAVVTAPGLVSEIPVELDPRNVVEMDDVDLPRLLDRILSRSIGRAARTQEGGKRTRKTVLKSKQNV